MNIDNILMGLPESEVNLEAAIEAEGTLDELLTTSEEMQRLWAGDLGRVGDVGDK